MFSLISSSSIRCNSKINLVAGTRLLSGFGGQNVVSLTSRHGLCKLYPFSSLHKAAFCTRHAAKSRLKDTFRKIDQHFTVISKLFAKQCHALCAQRIRRTAQIIMLYRQLGYDHRLLAQIVNRLRTALLLNGKERPLSVLLGAALFSWHTEKITEVEMKSVADEISEMHTDNDGKVTGKLSSDWEVVINKKHLLGWRKPLPNSELFEYKMFGTFDDIPARAFFNAQADVDYRKQWDKLIIKLDVIDRDENTGCEVVQWIMHFPYPMFSREYVFIRKRLIDQEKKLMVLMSRSTEHPLCPRKDDQYVRVDTYMSRMVIRPHGSFDENGFDFVLTYYDDPKANFPRMAYNWMASSGVPEYAEKMHMAAKTMHEWHKADKWSKEEGEERGEGEEEQAGQKQGM